MYMVWVVLRRFGTSSVICTLVRLGAWNPGPLHPRALCELSGPDAGLVPASDRGT